MDINNWFEAIIAVGVECFIATFLATDVMFLYLLWTNSGLQTPLDYTLVAMVTSIGVTIFLVMMGAAWNIGSCIVDYVKGY